MAFEMGEFYKKIINDTLGLNNSSRKIIKYYGDLQCLLVFMWS